MNGDLPPGKHDWLYNFYGSLADWVLEEDPVHCGSTCCIFCQSRSNGRRGYLKRAPVLRGDAWREKLASDLGQVTDVGLPPTLLVENGEAVIVKEVAGFTESAELYIASQEYLGNLSWVAELGPLYPSGVIAFDWWVANEDRHDNLGNLLCVYSVDGETVEALKPIDYNLSLLFSDLGAGRANVPSIELRPYPWFLTRLYVDLDKLGEICERIRDVEMPVIRRLVDRLGIQSKNTATNRTTLNVTEYLLKRGLHLEAAAANLFGMEA